MNGKEILRLIEIILERKLDFNNRSNGSRNVLNQWKKARAIKNDQLSVQFRETGNEHFRNGQLNDALHFYNEAVLFGRFYPYQIDILLIIHFYFAKSTTA